MKDAFLRVSQKVIHSIFLIGVICTSIGSMYNHDYRHALLEPWHQVGLFEAFATMYIMWIFWK